MNILAISDVKVPFIYSPRIRDRFGETDLVVACGDLPYYYQEYVLSLLDVPLFFVRGNHDKKIEHSVEGDRRGPGGGVDLHRRVICHRKLLLAGVEGSLRYRDGPYQYTQSEMWLHVIRLMPRLLVNKNVHGRYLDFFITHAPPLGIHDREDLPHQGIAAFRWLIEVCQPAFHIHGHIHIYRPDAVMETEFCGTRIVNAFGFREIAARFEEQVERAWLVGRK